MCVHISVPYIYTHTLHPKESEVRLCASQVTKSTHSSATRMPLSRKLPGSMIQEVSVFPNVKASEGPGDYKQVCPPSPEAAPGVSQGQQLSAVTAGGRVASSQGPCSSGRVSLGPWFFLGGVSFRKEAVMPDLRQKGKRQRQNGTVSQPRPILNYLVM